MDSSSNELNDSSAPGTSHQTQSSAASSETITQQISEATTQTLRLRLTKNPNKLQRRVCEVYSNIFLF